MSAANLAESHRRVEPVADVEQVDQVWMLAVVTSTALDEGVVGVPVSLPGKLQKRLRGRTFNSTGAQAIQYVQLARMSGRTPSSSS